MPNITFNGVAIPTFIKVNKVTTQALPDLENRTVKAPKLIGLYDMGTTLGGKKIRLDFTILNDGKYTTQDKQEIMAEWLRGDNFKASRLVLPDFPNSYYMAKVNNNIEVSDNMYSANGTIEFIILNPNRIDSAQTTTYLNTLSKTVTYTGTAEVSPILNITIQAPTNTIQIDISNSKYNNFIKLFNPYGNFQANETLRVDMRTKKVLKNGLNAMTILTLDSNFHKLVKGENIYTKNSDTGYSAYITYYAEYL